MSEIQGKIEKFAGRIFDIESEKDAKGVFDDLIVFSQWLKTYPRESEKKSIILNQIISAIETEREVTSEKVKEFVEKIQRMWLEEKTAEEIGWKIFSNISSQSTIPASVSVADGDMLSQYLPKLKGDLDDINALVVKIENDKSQESIGALKRIVHTVKGESGMLGLMEIQEVLHELESSLDLGWNDNLADVVFSVHDWIESFIQKISGKSNNDITPKSEIILKIKNVHSGFSASMIKGDLNKYIDFNPSSGPGIVLEDPDFINDFLTESNDHLSNVDQAVLVLEKDPNNIDQVNVVFRCYHTIKGISGMLNLVDVQKTAHVAENILDVVRQGRLKINQDIIDIIFSTTDKLKKFVEVISSCATTTRVLPLDTNTESFISILKDYLDDALGQTKKNARSAALEKAITHSPEEIQVAPKEDQSSAVSSSSKSAISIKAREMIKVDTEVLDRILNMIGELVIAESMVQRDVSVDTHLSTEAQRNLRQLEKITRELQDLSTSLRMTSIKPLFDKMARLVRDVAKKTGKKVSFSIEGEDTELDRNVVEKLSDPLVHMIRNSVDHGIETNVNERLSAGKTEDGHIKLKASYQGGNVHIQIIDDGRGINKEAVLNKAIEKGLIETNQKLTDEEIFSLIFMPGFSTAAQVTDVSGRGVGMDVVKKNIEALRGRIEISSKKGEGSCFTIILPLTLAIIDGMIVMAGGEKFIIPTLSIRESIQIKSEDIHHMTKKGESILVRDQLVPIHRLNEIFKTEDSHQRKNTSRLLVIVENASKVVGILLDEIIGQQQIVIKNLGLLFKKSKGLSGGAILADGRVGLIIDVSSLIESVHEAPSKNYTDDVKG